MDREIDDKEYRQQLAKEMYDAFCEKHIEMFPEVYTPSKKNFQAPEVSGVYTPPTWENLNEKLKQCWIAAASVIY